MRSPENKKFKNNLPIMNRRSFVLHSLAAGALPVVSALPLRASTPAARTVGKRLPIYSPRVETGVIYFKHPGVRPQLNYNHDVDVVRFKGRFYAAWNANWVESGKRENIEGQFNYVSTSDDFRIWSEPVKAFTSSAGAVNPIDQDNQWQPCFINDRDETLYCAWCTYAHRRAFVSHTTDGVRWTNVEVPLGPRELDGQVVGFPTAHGLLASGDVMMFPCSLPYYGDWAPEPGRRSNLIVGTTRYAAMLISRDRGKTWHWSKPIEAATWTEIGEDPKEFGGETVFLWEPTVYENADGTFGMLIRNSTAQDAPERKEKPHRMILGATSRDGETWTKARPIEVDSICSRILALSRTQTKRDLHMVMNDWHVGVPQRISFDRYFLSLFCSPETDPDLLLPGPVVQPPGGRAYYPNGFIENNTLYIGYSYASEMRTAVVGPLPDYSQPFLLPRGGRAGVVIDGDTAKLHHRYSSLGLVLTSALTRQETLRLAFRFAMFAYDGRSFPILTLGGKTRQGTLLRAIYGADEKSDLLQIRGARNAWRTVGRFRHREWTQVEVEIDSKAISISVGSDARVRLEQPVLRKISFGGLYETPEWPMGMGQASDLRIELSSISVA
jgi:hypothetical protein